MGKGYDKFGHRASDYDNLVSKANYIGPDKIIDALRRHFTLAGHIRILDLGAGTGLLGQVLRIQFPKAEIVAVDISPDMLDIARERRVYDELTVADLTDTKYPFDDNSFDLIASSGATEFIKDYLNIIVNMHRIVRPGGSIYSTFNLNTVNFESHVLRSRKRNERQGYEEKQIIEALSSRAAPAVFNNLNIEVLSVEEFIAYTQTFTANQYSYSPIYQLVCGHQTFNN